jgi:hypothetical protein
MALTGQTANVIASFGRVNLLSTPRAMICGKLRLALRNQSGFHCAA